MKSGGYNLLSIANKSRLDLNYTYGIRFRCAPHNTKTSAVGAFGKPTHGEKFMQQLKAFDASSTVLIHKNLMLLFHLRSTPELCFYHSLFTIRRALGKRGRNHRSAGIRRGGKKIGFRTYSESLC